MSYIDFPKDLTGLTHQTFRDAYDKSKDIITESHDMGCMNISGIITHIIQDTARFNERFGADVLCDIDNINTLCMKEYRLEQEIDEILVMGIREQGVDSNLSTLQEIAKTASPYSHMPNEPLSSKLLHPNTVYRRILAVRIQVTKLDEDGNRRLTPRITCGLRNITKHLYHISADDIDTSTGDEIIRVLPEKGEETE